MEKETVLIIAGISRSRPLDTKRMRQSNSCLTRVAYNADLMYMMYVYLNICTALYNYLAKELHVHALSKCPTQVQLKVREFMLSLSTWIYNYLYQTDTLATPRPAMQAYISAVTGFKEASTPITSTATFLISKCLRRQVHIWRWKAASSVASSPTEPIRPHAVLVDAPVKPSYGS